MDKRCFKCGEVKPTDGFYFHPHMADRHLGKCKECCKRDERLRRISKPDFIHAYDLERSHSERRKAYCRKRAAEWKASHPERARAITAVNNAVRDGRLQKPDKCELCGAFGKLHGHHTDYSKPLEVVWLCSLCHGQIQ